MSAGSGIGAITQVVAFHRKLGCDDESSTDEEQAERILYFYPESTSIPVQLSRVGMIQSMIDFAEKFSTDPIDVVVLEHSTLAFVECEPDFWIVFTASHGTAEANCSSNSSSSSSNHIGANNNLFYSHMPNGTGMKDAIIRMYRLFASFFGEVNSFLSLSSSTSSSPSSTSSTPLATGWEGINAVHAARKAVRKLHLQCKHMFQDLNYLENRMEERSQLTNEEDIEEFERNGIPLDKKGSDVIKDEIALLETKISEQKSALSLLIQSPSYTPLPLSLLLSSFIGWYIASGELHCISSLHGMCGMHFSPVGHPAFQSLMRVRQTIDTVSKGVCKGVLAINDGQIIWSDLDDITTFLIYDYLRVHEYNSIRTDVVQVCASPEMDATSALAAAVSVLGDSSKHPLLSTSGFLPEHWSNQWLSRKGFVTAREGENALGIVDIEAIADYVQELDEEQSDNHNYPRRTSCFQRYSTPDKTSATQQQSVAMHHYHLLGNAENTFNIWTPRIYSCIANSHSQSKSVDNNSNNTQQQQKQKKKKQQQAKQPRLKIFATAELGLDLGKSVCIGRALIYRQNRFLLLFLLPDWDDEEGLPFDYLPQQENSSEQPTQQPTQQSVSSATLTSPTRSPASSPAPITPSKSTPRPPSPSSLPSLPSHPSNIAIIAGTSPEEKALSFGLASCTLADDSGGNEGGNNDIPLALSHTRLPNNESFVQQQLLQNEEDSQVSQSDNNHNESNKKDNRLINELMQAHNNSSSCSNNITSNTNPELSLFWFCMAMQSNLMPELDKLQRVLSKATTSRPSSMAMTAQQLLSASNSGNNPNDGLVGMGSSGGIGGGIGGGGIGGMNATGSGNGGAAGGVGSGPLGLGTAGIQGGGGGIGQGNGVGNAQLQAANAYHQSMINVGKQKSTLPPGVRLLYYNVCNRAVKAVDIYRTKVDPLLLWPSLLRPNSTFAAIANNHPNSSTAASAAAISASSPQGLFPFMLSNTSSRMSMPRFSDPLHDPQRSPMVDLEDDYKELQERDFQPMYLSFPNHILVELRPRFPLSPSLLAASLGPGVIRAINDLREVLSHRYGRGPVSSMTEACLRVSSMPHGGVWVVARRLGERIVIFIVEGCGTLNEMQQQVVQTMDSLLGQIMI